ncbi:MAG: hypothetical protein N3A38_02350 [Planctomycetota bacterium]|nr:hypothetical protein [Planctomycetota bacterium]
MEGGRGKDETSRRTIPIYTAAELIRKSKAILRGKLEKLPTAGPVGRYEPAVVEASEIIKGRQAFQRTQVLVLKGMIEDGAKGIFFLWETAEGTGDSHANAYLIAHPQNFYDDSLADLVRHAVEHPATLRESDYFREWDRKRAAESSAGGGGPSLLREDLPKERRGLTIEIGGFLPAAIGDNSFRTTFTLRNTTAESIHVYESVDTGFRLRLRRKDAQPGEEGMLLVPDDGGILKGLDLDFSQYVTELDFQEISPKGSLTRSLYFSSAQYPALKDLKGKYLLSALYFSRQDGRQLGIKAWTGAIASEPIEVVFEPARLK